MASYNPKITPGSIITMQKLSPWISVEESLPNKLPVLAYSKDWSIFIADDRECIGFDFTKPYKNDENADTVITHWMPLPELPYE